MTRKVQVKICGITTVRQAEECVEAGADAIGLVFYGKSPRNVNIKQAVKICSAIPEQVAKIAVTVDMSILEIAEIIKVCKLDALQLHGSEAPEEVGRYKNLYPAEIIKHINGNGDDLLREAARYGTTVLVEATRGKLPGGNGISWDWSAAAVLAGKYPFILSGGLNSDNILQAIEMADPDAVDVSSGVEASPGIKDMVKVREFISRAKSHDAGRILDLCF